MSATPWLDVLIGLRKFYAAGVELVARSKINFGTGISAVDNPTTQMTDVTVDLSHVTMAGDVSGTAAAAVVGKIRGVTVSPDAPQEGQFPYYDTETSTLKYIDPPVIYGGTPSQAAARAAFYGELWGGPIRLAPLGTTADDAARAKAVWDVCAAGGWTCLMAKGGDGIWEWKTNPLLPSDITIEFEAGCAIRQALTPTGAQQSCAFRCGVTGSTLATALAATVTRGSRTITTHADVAVGSEIQIVQSGAGTVVQSYMVQAHAGSSDPYTLTLDRPVMIPFASGSNVYTVTLPKNIHIKGNGLVISGTGDRYFELVCRDSTIEDVTIDDRYGLVTDLAAAFEVGGRTNTWRKIRITGDKTNPPIGLAFESQDGSMMEDCVVRDCGTHNIIVIDSVHYTVLACQASGGGATAIGLQISGVSGQQGSVGGAVVGGSYCGCYRGVYISVGSLNNVIGVNADHNAYTGIEIDYCTDCSLVGVSASYTTDASTAGIMVRSSSSRIQIDDAITHDNTGAGITVQTPCSIRGHIAYNNASAALTINTTTGAVFVDGYDYYTNAANGTGIFLNSACRLGLGSGKIVLGASAAPGYAIYINQAAWTSIAGVMDLTCTHASSYGIYNATSGSTVQCSGVVKGSGSGDIVYTGAGATTTKGAYLNGE